MICIAPKTVLRALLDHQGGDGAINLCVAIHNCLFVVRKLLSGGRTRQAWRFHGDYFSN